MKKIYLPLFLLLALVIFWIANPYSTEEPIDFNTQVRPILNAHCLACHGGVKQQAGLSFLFEGEALQAAESGLSPIVPHHPNQSELIRRIEHPNPQVRMPPEGPGLNQQEQKLIRQWIKEGAKWATHWAYQMPAQQADLPPTNDWCRNEIDQFVLAQLETEQLNPSEEAPKNVLIRRLSLDLIGLPPSPAEVQQFLEDKSPDAYEKLVDRLLQSPHFGERWASFWLDLARYADSQGYQKDLIRRTIWRYRDWVIHAFNQDMPFDQFTIEQLAGDLLPTPTDNQLLATAFHRNTMTNDEGGTDDEEFRIAAVIDRLNTTMEVWQATTIACVQCHSHPYDPIHQKEFYQLYAFFNNAADHDTSDDFPKKVLFSPAQTTQKASLEKQMAQQTDTLSEDYQDLLKAYLAIQPAPVPVIQELPKDSSRKTHIFERGNWLVHGPEVQANVPAYLPSFPDSLPLNRLGFAQWLVNDQQPLTARVMVNRFWEQLFGNGLVTTLEDFGTQGEKPSHPDLLDWLALEFSQKHQWKIKPLLKQIVSSATYRQSSDLNPGLLEKDPNNQLLARGPRFRLSAEQIRDQALAISGLLHPELYGPSVMPHQPEGVWNVIRHAIRWQTDTLGNQHRRALYTFWRRVSPYPSMISFDAPSRELCVSKRIRTNTPLQALITLNDPVFVEAAMALAERMTREGGESIESRIQYGFQLALMRPPTPERFQSLVEFYQTTVEKYRQDPTLFQRIDEKEIESSPEKAALINVATVLLNLNEVITKT